MYRQWSIFSDKVISSQGLAKVMERLQAKIDEGLGTWVIERDAHKISIELAPDEVEVLAEDFQIAVEQFFDGSIASCIAVVYETSGEGNDELEVQLTRAIAIALAEKWPIVLDNHRGSVELIRPMRRFQK